MARMGERRGAYRVLAGKSKGEKPLGSSRRRREDNFKMNIQEVRWGHGLVAQVAGSCECDN